MNDINNLMRSSFQALIWFFHLIPHQICVTTSQNVKKFQQNVLRSRKSGRTVICTVRGCRRIDE